MTTWDTNVICNPDVGVLATTNLDLLLVFGVDNVKDLLIGLLPIDPSMNRFKHYVISLGLIDVHDVNESIPVSDCEREELFAQLAI